PVHGHTVELGGEVAEALGFEEVEQFAAQFGDASGEGVAGAAGVADDEAAALVAAVGSGLLPGLGLVLRPLGLGPGRVLGRCFGRCGGGGGVGRSAVHG